MDIKVGHTIANPRDYHIKKVYSISGRVAYEVTKGKGIFAVYIGEYDSRKEARKRIQNNV